MMYKHEPNKPETPRDRLAVIEHRIVRMKSVNKTEGDALALRLIAHAEAERRKILAEISAGERKPA